MEARNDGMYPCVQFGAKEQEVHPSFKIILSYAFGNYSRSISLSQYYA